MQCNVHIQGFNYITHNLDNTIVTKLPNSEDENHGIQRKAGKIWPNCLV